MEGAPQFAASGSRGHFGVLALGYMGPVQLQPPVMAVWFLCVRSSFHSPTISAAPPWFMMFGVRVLLRVERSTSVRGEAATVPLMYLTGFFL
jgi:hypothetical protein